jgi:hypothetical protein
MTVRTLGGCAVENFKGVGSFKDDPQFGKTNSRFSYDAKLNLSTSLKLKDLKCNTCPEKGPHTVLFPNGGGHDKTNQSPRCFVLTDQNFLPAVPVAGEGECLKIVAVEDAKLSELADTFLELSKGFDIPSGSVVLLFSASHLAWAGPAAYSKEWVAARGKIMRVLGGGGVEIVQGFPLLQAGTADISFIRGLIELELWHDQLGLSKGRDICITRKNVYSAYFPEAEPVVATKPGAGMPLVPEESGMPLAPGTDPQVLKMPTSVSGHEEGMFLSPGFTKLPGCLDPLGPEEEVNLLLDLIRELNEKFMLDLDEDVKLVDKLLADQDEPVTKPKRYLVVGNSHASRIACALEDLGYDAKLISAVGWASDPDLINSVVQLIREEVELCEDELVILYFLYDNEAYM